MWKLFYFTYPDKVTSTWTMTFTSKTTITGKVYSVMSSRGWDETDYFTMTKQ